MPEGPEIKSSSIILNSWIQNDKLVEIDPADIAGKYSKKEIKGFSLAGGFIGKTCEEVRCKGKLLYFAFDEDHAISCNFGMAAQWSKTKNKHTCFSLTFEQAGKIYFNDMRHFGNIEFLDKKKLKSKLDDLGTDFLALEESEVADVFYDIEDALGKSKEIIADDLMNQKIFSGVGNYIRAEALYMAKIDPSRYSFSLSDKEIMELCLSISSVMRRSLKLKGASILTYKNSDETLGEFTFKCYGRDKDDHGNEILTKKTKNDRTLYYCPEIYK